MGCFLPRYIIVEAYLFVIGANYLPHSILLEGDQELGEVADSN
jgi:hypothetical protein